MPFAIGIRVLLLTSTLLVTDCTLNDTAPGGTYIRLEGSSQLTTYQRVTILFGDTLGNVRDTLYDDSLPSLAKLNRLPVVDYKGGAALISIHGYRNNALVYSESRVYDGRTQKVLSLNISKPDSLIPVNQPLPPVGVVSTSRNPSLSVFPRDTIVSIKDSVILTTEALDPDGDLFAYSWSCTGPVAATEAPATGTFAADSSTLQGSRQKIAYGKRFAQPGNYTCALRIYDKGGRRCDSSTSIRVELDPPRADAGRDTTVVAGTKIYLHGMGYDGYGPIYAQAWKIGDLNFYPVYFWESSTLAPNTPGDLLCILRVMDKDSLFALDTMVVTVILK
jgi:hypothetical protein